MNNRTLFERLYDLGLSVYNRGKVDFFKVAMPDNVLADSLKTDLLRAFCAFTDELYGSDTSFHWFGKKGTEKKVYFATISHIWLVFKDQQLVGFSAIRILDGCGERIIYVDNMNIQRVSGKIFSNYSIGSMLVNEILQENWQVCLKPVSVVFRTQNANVYRLGYSILPHGTYPRMTEDKVRDETRNIRVNTFMASILSPGKRFIERTSVIKQAFGGCIYGADNPAIRTQHQDIKAFWEKHVDIDNGDAMLISVCPTRFEFIAAITLYRCKVLFLFKRFFRQSSVSSSYQTRG